MQNCTKRAPHFAVGADSTERVQEKKKNSWVLGKAFPSSLSAGSGSCLQVSESSLPCALQKEAASVASSSH